MGTVSLKAVALRFLAQREHSRAELEQKLRRHLVKVSRARDTARREAHCATHAAALGVADVAAADGSDIDIDTDTDNGANSANDSDSANDSGIAAALDALARSGLLSDERTAASVLRSQGQRYGALRLKHTLQSKGLSADLVAHTVAMARDTELQRAQAVWAKRFGLPPQAPQDRARQMRFLAQRGFDAETVGRVMRSALGGPAADSETTTADVLPEGADTVGFSKKRPLASNIDPDTPL